MSLSTSSVNSAYPLATIVTRSGKSLGVADGSALADCLDACDDGFAGIAEDGVEYVSDETPEVQVVQNAGEEHTAQCEQLVDLAARAVAFTMDVARNHVNPKVKRVVDVTEAYIDGKRAARLAPLLIEPSFTPDIYHNADLQDLLAKHAESLHKDIPAQVIAAKWGGNGAAVGDICTGIPSLDAEICNHFSGREGYVQDLWERYFSNVPGKFRSADFRHDITGQDDPLVLFLGAHALLNSDTVPEGLDTDLAGYRAYVGGIKDQMGSQIARRLKHAKNAAAAKQLVIDAPRPSRPGEVVSGTIAVEGLVYNQWLAAGGSPEALMGACLTGDALSYTATLESAAANTAAWERHLNGLNAQAVFEQRTHTLQGLRRGMIEVYGDEFGGDGDSQLDMGGINHRLASLNASDLDNLYKVARDLVCDTWYGHTDAKAFLEAYDDAACKCAGMDAAQIAMQVATDYVTHWVASCITVSGETISNNN